VHKRFLENDLIHLEDILDEDIYYCSARKRAPRIEVELVDDQEVSYSLGVVKQAILDDYVPTVLLYTTTFAISSTNHVLVAWWRSLLWDSLFMILISIPTPFARRFFFFRFTFRHRFAIVVLV
jgi:hypothetical protein